MLHNDLFSLSSSWSSLLVQQSNFTEQPPHIRVLPSLDFMVMIFFLFLSSDLFARISLLLLYTFQLLFDDSEAISIGLCCLRHNFLSYFLIKRLRSIKLLLVRIMIIVIQKKLMIPIKKILDINH